MSIAKRARDRHLSLNSVLLEIDSNRNHYCLSTRHIPLNQYRRIRVHENSVVVLDGCSFCTVLRGKHVHTSICVLIPRRLKMNTIYVTSVASSICSSMKFSRNYHSEGHNEHKSSHHNSNSFISIRHRVMKDVMWSGSDWTDVTPCGLFHEDFRSVSPLTELKLRYSLSAPGTSSDFDMSYLQLTTCSANIVSKADVIVDTISESGLHPLNVWCFGRSNQYFEVAPVLRHRCKSFVPGCIYLMVTWLMIIARFCSSHSKGLLTILLVLPKLMSQLNTISVQVSHGKQLNAFGDGLSSWLPFYCKWIIETEKLHFH